VSEPDRLAVIWTGRWRDGGMSPGRVSYLNLDDLRNMSRTLIGLAGWQEVPVSVAAPGITPKPVQGGYVTADFFDVLGIRLAAGRGFLRDEDTPPHGAKVVVVSASLAERAFGSAESSLGQAIHVNGRLVTVVGVAPRSFGGGSPTSQVEVWYPGALYMYLNHTPDTFAQRYASRAGGLFYTFIGRLAPGETAGSAQAELDTLVPLLAERHPEDNAAFKVARARVFPGLGPGELIRPKIANLVRGLLIVAGVLLLLGCANVTNLLLSEGVRQRPQRAVRIALGADRGRLIRQLLTETLVLSITGAVLGVGLAIWLKQAIQVLIAPELGVQPIPIHVPIDRLVLSITLGTAVVCGIVAGVVPAWIGTSKLSGVISGGGARTGTRAPRLRTAFAAVQFALSLALVTGAMLMVATLRNYANVDLGFEPAGVHLQWLSLRSHGYTPDRVQVYNTQMLERLTADPAFDAVSLATGFPFGYNLGTRLRTPGGNEKQTTDVDAVSTTDRFPEVLGMQLLRGRYFRADEVLIAARVSGGPVVLSESLTRLFFGDADAVGQSVTMPAMMGFPARDFTVIGVMRDTLTSRLNGRPDLILYEPMAAEDFRLSTVVLTKARVPLDRVNAISEQATLALDATMPLRPAESIRSWIDRGLASVRVFAWVLSLLGVVGFVLAAVGLYGLLSQAVGERRREFGVRLAIGASNQHIAGLVLRQAAWTSVLGTVAGLGLAYWGSGLVKSYLFGVSEFDPRVYAMSAAVLLVVVFAAAIRPAWMATRVNPIETLRAE
jgi:predicted permease